MQFVADEGQLGSFQTDFNIYAALLFKASREQRGGIQSEDWRCLISCQRSPSFSLYSQQVSFDHRRKGCTGNSLMHLLWHNNIDRAMCWFFNSPLMIFFNCLIFFSSWKMNHDIQLFFSFHRGWAVCGQWLDVWTEGGGMGAYIDVDLILATETRFVHSTRLMLILPGNLCNRKPLAVAMGNRLHFNCLK